MQTFFIFHTQIGYLEWRGAVAFLLCNFNKLVIWIEVGANGNIAFHLKHSGMNWVAEKSVCSCTNTTPSCPAIQQIQLDC